jgi:hypothetical protein
VIILRFLIDSSSTKNKNHLIKVCNFSCTILLLFPPKTAIFWKKLFILLKRVIYTILFFLWRHKTKNTFQKIFVSAWAVFVCAILLLFAPKSSHFLTKNLHYLYIKAMDLELAILHILTDPSLTQNKNQL